jgi:hypothetical protein
MNPLDDNGESLLQFIEKASGQELDAFLERARVYEVKNQTLFFIGGFSTEAFAEIKTSSVSIRASISINSNWEQYSPKCPPIMSAGTFEEMPLAA